MNTNTKRHQFQLTCVATEMGCSVKMFHYLPFFKKKKSFFTCWKHIFPPFMFTSTYTCLPFQCMMLRSSQSLMLLPPWQHGVFMLLCSIWCLPNILATLLVSKGNLDFSRTKILPPLEIQILLIFLGEFQVKCPISCLQLWLSLWSSLLQLWLVQQPTNSYCIDRLSHLSFSFLWSGNRCLCVFSCLSSSCLLMQFSSGQI